MENLNKDQFDGHLPMFLSAGELQKYVTHSVDSLQRSGAADDELWHYKEKESRVAAQHSHTMDNGRMIEEPRGSGVYDSIQQHGFNWDHPVSVSHQGDRRVMGDGHHRVAAAAAQERETGKPIYIPINHLYGYPSPPVKNQAQGI